MNQGPLDLKSSHHKDYQCMIHDVDFIHVCDYSTAALIRNAKNRLKVHLFTLFSLDIFDMRVEKTAVSFDKIFNLMFLLCFSVIKWNFGMFLVLFNGGSSIFGRMDIN